MIKCRKSRGKRSSSKALSTASQTPTTAKPSVKATEPDLRTNCCRSMRNSTFLAGSSELLTCVQRQALGARFCRIGFTRMMSSAKVPKKIKIIVLSVWICKTCKQSTASSSSKATSPQKRQSTKYCRRSRAVKLTSSFQMVLQTSLDSTKLTSIYKLSCFRLHFRSRQRC